MQTSVNISPFPYDSHSKSPSPDFKSLRFDPEITVQHCDLCFMVFSLSSDSYCCMWSVVPVLRLDSDVKPVFV